MAEVPRGPKSIEITSISVLFGLTTFQKTIKTLAGLETQQNKGLRHRRSSPLPGECERNPTQLKDWICNPVIGELHCEKSGILRLPRLWCSGSTVASQAPGEGSIPFSRFADPSRSCCVPRLFVVWALGCVLAGCPMGAMIRVVADEPR